MPTVPVYDVSASQVGEANLPDEVFGLAPRPAVMHQAVLAHLANQRQGTASTKSRGEVQGSGRKLFRQKGTGRARAGDRRSPTRVKGGAAHGPKPRDYEQALPKKMKRLALKSALSAKLAAGGLKLMEALELEKISTRRLAEILKGLQVAAPTILAVNAPDEKLLLSARNLPNLRVLEARNLNAYEVIGCGSLLLTKDGVRALEEVIQ